MLRSEVQFLVSVSTGTGLPPEPQQLGLRLRLFQTRYKDPRWFK
jgi:hypothetical protein